MLRFDLLRSSYLQKCRPNSPEVEAKIRSGRSQRSFEKPATAPSKVGHWPWCPGGWTKPSTSRHVATLVTFSNDLIWFNASWRIYWHLNQFWAFLLCLCKVNLHCTCKVIWNILQVLPTGCSQIVKLSNCQIISHLRNSTSLPLLLPWSVLSEAPPRLQDCTEWLSFYEFPSRTKNIKYSKYIRSIHI